MGIMALWKANVDQIRRSIDEFSWKRCFANTSVNNKVHMFNKIIENTISNYILHETKQLFAMTEINLEWIKISNN